MFIYANRAIPPTEKTSSSPLPFHSLENKLADGSCGIQTEVTTTLTSEATTIPTVELTQTRLTRSAAARAKKKFKRWAAELTEDS